MNNQLSTSLQYVDPVVTCLKGNPTTDVVQMAFTTVGVDPQPTDWKTASWDTTATLGTNQYLAQCLVGPGGTVTLAVGSYQYWVKVTDNPEIPELPVGMLTIY